MKQKTKWFKETMVTAGSLVLAGSALANTPIAIFDENFYMDGLFAWADATVVSDATGYSITDTGYGSGYKDINPNVDATGETTIELTVTLSGTPALPTDPVSGPIVSLVDGDGTFVNFAWFGQPVGTHVLTNLLSTPTWTASAGTVPGLDLATLDFFHLQDDPGAYAGIYTIKFVKFRLIGKPEPVLQITSHSYNPTSKEFALTWSSLAGKNYTVLQSATANGTYLPLVADIASGGTTTTTTVTMPAGDAGFLRIQEQP